MRQKYRISVQVPLAGVTFLLVNKGKRVDLGSGIVWVVRYSEGMFEDLFAYDVDELDTAAVLTAAATSRALRERLEVLDLLHALRIADLHHEARVAAGRD